MISTLKPYGAYRETGLSWVPICPSHWKKSRLKDWVSINRATLPEHTDEAFCFLYLDISSVDSGYLVSKPQRLSFGEAPSRARRIVFAGDTLISTVRTYLKAVLHVEWLEDGPIIASTGFAVLTPKDGTVPAYVGYVVQSEPFVNSVVASSIGVAYPAIAESVLGSLSVLIPPYDEQEAIVRFIGHLGQRVNRLIQAKRQLIALLNEQKQAIIQQAVTRGLDSSVPLRPSGIDWLGYIPQHWDSPLMARQLYSVEQGWSPRAAEGDLLDEQWAVVSLSAVKRGRFDNKALKPIELNTDVPEHYEIHRGDLLLTRSNTRALVGDICLVKHVRPRTIISDLIYRLKLRSTLEPKFAMYWLLSPSGRYQIERDARGSSDTMPKISQQHIKGWRIPVPPLGEQAEISAYVERETEQLTLATEKAQREIDLLREYRARLVADVVMGQLDVRHLGLPEVINEPVSLVDDPDDLDGVANDLAEAAV